MRISCFLYFLLLASPLAAEAPLSAIDWLSIKKNDVDQKVLETVDLKLFKLNDGVHVKCHLKVLSMT